jgi:4a-hydroxytetrahydrobiopterin dehydratase
MKDGDLEWPTAARRSRILRAAHDIHTLLAPMRQKLSDLEIQRALGTLSGWARRGDVLTKTFTFDRFADGIAFVDRVAKAADAMDHHPDIDIRYTKITVALSTHDAGGITQSDLSLAETIEGLAVRA